MTYRNLTDPALANDEGIRSMVDYAADVARRLALAMDGCPGVDVHETAMGISEMMTTVAKLSSGNFGIENVYEYSGRVARFGNARDRLAALERSQHTRVAEA